MTILITGAAGFIGMHTCLELLKKKHKVVVFMIRLVMIDGS